MAVNACSWALKSASAEVRPDVAAFIKAFFKAGKPVGAICIAPALVALSLAQDKIRATLTLGDGQGTKPDIEKLGHHFQAVASPCEIVVDEKLKLITTPAYMFSNARLSDIWVGIERCVSEVLNRIDAVGQ